MIIRAIPHIHSDWSKDGKWTLKKIAHLFKMSGYNCVLTTEHDESLDNNRWQSYRTACLENSTDKFLIIPGIEYSDKANIVHILVWGNIPFFGKDRITEELLKDVKEFQGISVLAHPSRKDAWQKYKICWTPFLFGIEQWNRKVDGVAPSREAMVLLEKNPVLVPFVGLDFHRLNQFFPLALAVQVTEGLCEEKVLRAVMLKKVTAEVLGYSVQHFTKKNVYKTAERVEIFRRFVRRIIKKS